MRCYCFLLLIPLFEISISVFLSQVQIRVGFLFQVYQSNLNKKAEVIERHLSEAEHMNGRIPQFHTAEKAKQLANRYFALVTSVQVRHF